jgi:prefoldin subunit 5
MHLLTVYENQELEEVNERLDAEKIKLEQAFAELREQLTQVQRDYDDISMAISIVEEDRQSLLKTAHTLQSSLQDLEKEKREILQCLEDAGLATGRKEKKKKDGGGGDTYVRELQACLDLIEEERQMILKEQNDIQSR